MLSGPMRTGPRKVRQPRAVTCYICGTQHTIHSFAIHVRQCRRLFVEREKTKHRSERRPLPPCPPAVSKLLGEDLDPHYSGGGEEVSASSGGGGGGRRRPKSAGGGAMEGIDLEALNAQAFETFNDKAMARCDVCGRTFLPERLEIHRRSCRPGNAARAVGDVGPSHGRGGGGAIKGLTPSRPQSAAPPQRERRRRSPPKREFSEAHANEATGLSDDIDASSHVSAASSRSGRLPGLSSSPTQSPPTALHSQDPLLTPPSGRRTPTGPPAAATHASPAIRDRVDRIERTLKALLQQVQELKRDL